VVARRSLFAAVRGGLKGGQSRVLGFRVRGLARVGDGGLDEEDDWSLVRDQSPELQTPPLV
jgi:hypothetical protein